MRLIDPVPADRRPARLALLLGGLALYGVSVAMMLQAGLGQMPWGVLDQGVAGVLGVEVGTGSILVGAVVLLLWVPLHRRPGLGTLCNVVLIGLSINATLALLPAPEALGARVPLLLAGVLLNAVATCAYIGAGLGAGPRDGLTTGIAARGHSVRVVRTTIELLVLGAGWLLGGTVGAGTVVYAAAIGLLMHSMLPVFRLRDGQAAAVAPPISAVAPD
ncbi:hypothetical protein O2W18_05795 [Modestobacter sp. VKM Ac-2983]|uniref:membrane protein YczE n=1 Tax=Modestobacter sp. VKM Ac-2983 TaxID=3004137 RepID=UPI0022AB52FC|nr:hypothetical protein [Modestobacter sp. VKM Ac-2983]MCZ2804606.1 hypothetical protein [Modestobacter sp. VKM Ac-2983]